MMEPALRIKGGISHALSPLLCQQEDGGLLFKRATACAAYSCQTTTLKESASATADSEA